MIIAVELNLSGAAENQKTKSYCKNGVEIMRKPAGDGFMSLQYPYIDFLHSRSKHLINLSVDYTFSLFVFVNFRHGI
jgi:hypothetical protein